MTIRVTTPDAPETQLKTKIFGKIASEATYILLLMTGFEGQRNEPMFLALKI